MTDDRQDHNQGLWPDYPLTPSKVSNKVASALVEDIVRQGLQPGDRLPAEAAMLERFKVGRASIREGLRLLETYGLLTIRPGQKGGPSVAALGADDLGRTLSLFFRLSAATYRDLIVARIAIEPVMARLAAERRDPEEMEQLGQVMERESQTQVDEYLSPAREFHHAVCGASGNPVLNLLGQSLHTLYTQRLHARNLFPKEARETVRTVHSQIGKAIREGDADRAEQLMRDHMIELARLQDERTPLFMDERISWES